MINKTKIMISLTLMICSNMLLTGCGTLPILVGGGAIALGAENIAARRGVKGIWYDYSVKNSVRNIWKQNKLEVIPCVTYDNILMIYGATLEDTTEHIKLAREIKSVKKVIDYTYKSEDITNIPSNEDILLKMKVKSLLTASPSIQSRNLYIRVLKNRIYILGSTYTEEEKNSIIKTVSGIRNVQAFFYFIYVKANDKSILLPN